MTVDRDNTDTLMPESDTIFPSLQTKDALDVTAKPSRQGVLDAGIDKLSITWKLSSTAKKQANFTTIKVKLCYAPVSQVDRPWRKTENELFKDKTCPHKIITRAYNKSSQSFKYTLDRDIPTGTYFVRTYAVDAKDHEVAFGQSTNEAKTTNLFSVQAISAIHDEPKPNPTVVNW
ncbi:hypothetical protein HID58_002264 [Brassica napus]|uniref:High-affinity nitrate transporter n=1 Tax=Brassica napus TaxID=3708 RepID=A0ABQ8ELS2_BRANA|nr:hypothetical protein HID58_002264 [Brassica napus]